MAHRADNHSGHNNIRAVETGDHSRRGIFLLQNIIQNNSTLIFNVAFL